MGGSEDQAARRIGRYDVVRKIATGGMAELFLARFVGPGGFEKRCALKRILPQFAADTTFTRMFLTEAKITAMFDHPNIVQIFELGEDDEGQFFIAMELVNGMNLRQLLQTLQERQRQIPPELAAFMMAQALDGLAYAHEFRDESGPLGLVHRDVSPQNILVSYEGAVKVVDFGIVKGSSISGETQTGMLKGKIAYMSPEQASGEPLDGRSDIFAIGVVLYELITGRKPFSGATEVMYLKSVLDDPPPPIVRFVPDCPEELEGIIYRALAKRREDRHQSARQLQVAIQAFLARCPVPIGRHIVAEFMQSLSAEVPGAFDATRLRIPRTATGSVAQPGGGPASTSDVPAAFALASGSSSNPGLGASGAPLITAGGTGVSSPGATVMRAAGIGRPQPRVIAAFIGTALAGALVAYALEPAGRNSHAEGGSARLTATAADPAHGPASPSAPGARLDRPLPDPAPDPAGSAPGGAPPAGSGPSGHGPASEGRGPAPDATRGAGAVAEPGRARLVDEPRTAVSGPAEAGRAHPADEARGSRSDAHRGRHPVDPASAGTLNLSTVPRGLAVTLGDRPLGRTPLVDVVLPAGTHTLRVSNRRLGIVRDLTVHVARGQHTAETMTIGKGTLKVNARPWAEVYVDGVSRGKTPLEMPIYEGTHELRLVTEAGEERIQRIEVKTGATEDVRVKF